MAKKIKLFQGDIGFLSDLTVGQEGEVLSLQIEKPSLRRRLLDMGITKGVKISITKFAPMGDPVDVRVRGYELCLRREDMKGIEIRCTHD